MECGNQLIILPINLLRDKSIVQISTASQMPVYRLQSAKESKSKFIIDQAATDFHTIPSNTPPTLDDGTAVHINNTVNHVRTL